MEGTFATKIEKLRSCVRPFSFFSLIESLIPQENNSRSLHRFCTLMRKMNAQSFVMEDLELNQELKDEKEMLEVCTNGSVDYRAIRLTFFCSSPKSNKWADVSELPDEHILGYAVIAQFKLLAGDIFTHVLEAVVKPPCTFNEDSSCYEYVPNYYVHNVRSFKTTLGARSNFREIKFYGTFFTQQNTITSVCAHACLRMALNSSPLLTGSKLVNKEINDILKIEKYDSHNGLNLPQIRKVVESRGFTTHIADFTSNTRVEYDHFLYPALESCFPTILGIQWWDRELNQPTGHVVTVLGHTSNFDRWQPEANRGYGNFPLRSYISSAEWCDHYVISDDNYGMYSALPSEAMRNFVVPGKNPNPHASMAVTIVPKEVNTRGYMAEQFAIIRAISLIESMQLDPPNVWLDRLKNRHQDRTEIVCRTLLQKKKDYIKHIAENNSNLTPEQNKCLGGFPEYVWVTEISLPNLYSANKDKLGDVVIRADATEEQLTNGDAFGWAWLPGFVQLGNTTNFETWGIHSHIPLIRNIECPLSEW